MRIAIIGCGAVAEYGHLPALAKLEKLQVTVLIDKNRARAEELAARYHVVNVAEEIGWIDGKVDAAIVALPHHLHAPVCSDLLRQGIHVLVEKPMALSTYECDAMIRAAAQGHAVLAVGLMRRFQWSARFAKGIIDSGLLGSVESFDIREGMVYDWPVASDFFFKKESAGGGVLIDTGAHTLDSLLWWLGNVTSFEYFDDACGGVEANCVLRLETASGARGIVELSRTRNLRNTAILRGQRGTLEVGLQTNQAKISGNDSSYGLAGRVIPEPQPIQLEQAYEDLMRDQLVSWALAIDGREMAGASGVEARRSIALIESCYSQRKPLSLPWMTVESAAARFGIQEALQ